MLIKVNAFSIIRKMDKVGARRCVKDRWLASIILWGSQRFYFNHFRIKLLASRHLLAVRKDKWSAHPLHIFAEGLAKAGTEDLKLDVRIGAAVFEVHRPRQTRDVTLWSHRVRTEKSKVFPF